MVGVSGIDCQDEGAPERALLSLLGGMSAADFFRNHYEQAPLVVTTGDARRFADLLTLADVDRFLAEADLREGMVEVTRSDRRIPREEYSDDRGRISAAAVADLYGEGATIILPSLHESIFRLGAFCRSLEALLSCHVQTNVYLTPAGHQGFAPHYDNHDVFVLQVAGAKAWRFYGTPVATPYRGEGFEPGVHEVGEATRLFTLEAGDCLYMPRGLMHDAENVGEAPSLHITVGLITRTWADLLLESLSELALEEPDFRRSLPPGFATRNFDREEARRHFTHLLDLVSRKASMDGAFDLLSDNFLRGRRPDLTGVIAGTHALGEDQTFVRRGFAPWSLADDEGQLVLVGPGGELAIEEADAQAVEQALSGAAFKAADLPSPQPMRLCRRLWSAGYLERRDRGPAESG